MIVTKMKDFLKPDKEWKRFGISSKEDFINKFVTHGKFHSKVPEVIKKDFEIVERLQFYSYYEYELLEEAFAKATKIFEASVDLRIRILGLPNKNGFENLNSKIKKLEKHSSPELFQAWDEVRKLRNIFAHHLAGRSLAPFTINIFKAIVNVINSVFLDVEEIFGRENSLKKIKGIFFEKGLFLMKVDENFTLISSCIPHGIALNNGIEQSSWCFDLVYDKIVIEKFEDFAHPVIFTLENVTMNDNILKARLVDLDTEVEIFQTELPEAITRHEIYCEAFLKANPKIKEEYYDMLHGRIAIKVSQLVYDAW